MFFVQTVDMDKVQKEFQFFPQQRYSFRILSDIVSNVYEKIVEELGQVPSLGFFTMYLSVFRAQVNIERYIYNREDEGKELNLETDDPWEYETKRYVREMWDTGGYKDIDNFVYEYMNSTNGFGVSSAETDAPFYNDIAYILNANHFYFHNVPFYDNNLTDIKKGKGIYNFEVNNPIVEVW